MKYGVITADIIRSKEIKDRNYFFKIFSEKTNYINKRFSSLLLAPFKIYRGDEFQGCVKEINKIPEFLSIIRENFYPLQFRAGIGIGSISTKIKKDIGKIDGEALRLSSQALNIIKKEKERITYYKITPEYKHLEEIINNLYIFLDLNVINRTIKQWDAIRLYRDIKNLKKVAKKLNVTFQNVSKRLRAAHWLQYYQLERFLIKKLEEYFSHN